MMEQSTSDNSLIPAGRRTARAMVGLILLLGAGLMIPRLAARPALAAAAHQSDPAMTKLRLTAEPAGMKMAPTNHSLTTVNPGQTFRIVLYAYFTHPVSAHIELAIAHNGRQLFLSRGNFAVTKSSLGGTTQGWRWFWAGVQPCAPAAPSTGRPGCLPRAAGRYTVTGTIRFRQRRVLDEVGAGFYLTVR